MTLKQIVSLQVNQAEETKTAQFYTQSENGLYFWASKWLITDEDLPDTNDPVVPEEPETPEDPETPDDPETQYMSWDLSAAGDGSVMAVADGDRWGSTSTITISGDGPIKDFTFDDPSPFTQIGNVYELIIEEGVTRIGTLAFYRSSVTELNLPESVRSFGQYAFYQSMDLERVTMGDNLVLIDNSAFRACSALKEITLSPGLTAIQDGAFVGAALTTITIPAECSFVGATAFQLCSSMVTCYIERPSGEVFTTESNAFDFQSEGATIYVHGNDIAAALEDTYDNRVTTVALF